MLFVGLLHKNPSARQNSVGELGQSKGEQRVGIDLEVFTREDILQLWLKRNSIFSGAKPPPLCAGRLILMGI